MKKLLRFIGTYWLQTILAPPAIIYGFVALIGLGAPSFFWTLFMIALMVVTAMVLGAWIRNAWLQYNGRLYMAAEGVGGHSVEVQDNTPGKYREAKTGKRLFTEEQMLGFAKWVDQQPYKYGDNIIMSDLQVWVKLNKIP